MLNLVILPIRSPKSARLYQKVWTEEGSPLLAITRKQAAALRKRLPADIPVAIGMRYGAPSIDDAVKELISKACSEIIVLPLYPQFSHTTTQTTLDAVGHVMSRHLMTQHSGVSIRAVEDFHCNPAYIAALASSIDRSRQNRGPCEHLIMSFHGIPVRYAELGDPYAKHCETTARLLAKALNLDEGSWTLAYQSRFGREPWLEPFTDDVLMQLGQAQTTSLEILCPGFPTDCLETLEEIQIRGKEIFTSSGGGEYHYVPALNDNPDFISALEGLIREMMP